MTESTGVIEMDLSGNVITTNGDFANQSKENINKISQNIYFILQDINNIKNKKGSFGNFQKLAIKDDSIQYEVAIGATTIKIFKFKKA